jgi:hypothetical protein
MSFKTLLFFACTSLILFSAPSFAKKGTESGGGGDASEARVDEIRSDILNWINNDGARGLILPSDISYGEYLDRMGEILKQQKVIVSFVEQDDENNNELSVIVNGIPKTCRGFISKADSRLHILCNISRFKNTSESEQYKLIHHEFAGLVNLERNEGAASDYVLSNQITDYLSRQTVLKLAVKKPEGKQQLARTTIAMNGSCKGLTKFIEKFNSEANLGSSNQFKVESCSEKVTKNIITTSITLEAVVALGQGQSCMLDNSVQIVRFSSEPDNRIFLDQGSYANELLYAFDFYVEKYAFYNTAGYSTPYLQTLSIPGCLIINQE